jgi:hypothetical protein
VLAPLNQRMQGARQRRGEAISRAAARLERERLPAG